MARYKSSDKLLKTSRSWSCSAALHVVAQASPKDSSDSDLPLKIHRPMRSTCNQSPSSQSLPQRRGSLAWTSTGVEGSMRGPKSPWVLSTSRVRTSDSSPVAPGPWCRTSPINSRLSTPTARTPESSPSANKWNLRTKGSVKLASWARASPLLLAKLWPIKAGSSELRALMSSVFITKEMREKSANW